MRWVFIALVLANVALFVWHSVESSRLERLDALGTTLGSAQGVVSGAPLVLVSELTEQQKLELAKPKVAVAVVAGTVVKETPAVETPDNKEDVSIKEVAPLESKVSSIEVAQESAPSKPLVTEPNQCLRLGPATSSGQAEQVSQRLMAFTIITDIVDVDVPGRPEYWVILPPFSDEKAALQKMQEVQGRGISAQIIPKGELANAISFGLHGQQAEANKQAAELNAKGFRVIVKAIPVTHKEKWLALSERQTPKLTEALWESIHTDFPKLNKQVKNCY